MPNTWLTINEYASLLGVSKQALHQRLKKSTNGYVTREVTARGGTRLEIALDSLPRDVQARYWAASFPPLEEAGGGSIDYDSKLYLEAPEYNRRKADKYKRLLAETDGMTRKRLDAFIAAWNIANPDCTTSRSSLYVMRKAYAERGIVALLGKYGKTRDRSFAFEVATTDDDISAEQKIILDDCYAMFKSLYMQEGAQSAYNCWNVAHGLWIKRSGGCADLFDGAPFPCADTFLRRLEKAVPADAIYLARYGFEAWNRKHGTYVDRDFSGINPGEAWTSDHHQLDVGCYAPALYVLAEFAGLRAPKSLVTDKVVFPWLTVMQCLRTGRFLGWCLHTEAPNSDHIFQAFAHAASRYGIPKYLLIDNGKDYRAKDFAGGRRTVRCEIDDRATQSLTAQLDINVLFAEPYNAQTKLCERYFRIVKERFGKFSPGYRGGDVTERPEKLEREIKHGQILTWSELVPLLDAFIEHVVNTTAMPGSKHLQGFSPAQAWTQLRNDAGYTPHRVTDDALALYCTRVSKGRRIDRNGWLDAQLQQYYFAEWMFANRGKSVYARRDPRRWQTAWFFDADTHEFIGKAQLAQLTPGIAKTEIERAQVREAVAHKKRARKFAQAAARVDETPTLDVVIALQQAANAADAGDPTPQTNVIKFTHADEIIAADDRLRLTGTHDLPYTPEPVKKKKYRSDLDAE